MGLKPQQTSAPHSLNEGKEATKTQSGHTLLEFFIFQILRIPKRWSVLRIFLTQPNQLKRPWLKISKNNNLCSMCMQRTSRSGNDMSSVWMSSKKVLI